MKDIGWAICRKFPSSIPRLRFVSKLAKNGRLLDEGCGNGYILSQYMKIRNDLQFSACDILENSKVIPGDVDFRVIDIQVEYLPWPDNFFDGVVFNHVIEHLTDPHFAVGEAHRVLKNRGKIYVEAPSIRSTFLPSFTGWLGSEGGPINFLDDVSHIQPYTKATLRSLLEKKGFSRIKSGVVMSIPVMLLAPLLTLGGLLLKRRDFVVVGIHSLTGWSVYATAEKP